MVDTRFYPDEPPFAAVTTFRPNGSIKFDPLLFEQRYSFVVNLLGNTFWRDRIKTVADFGCADLSFFRVLRSLHFLEKVYLVDIDGDQLKQCQHRVQPITHDFITRREKPFRVEVFRGSVDHFSSRIHSLDAFVAIELIEHLYPGELERLPYHVFHLIRPQIAIFTTPNSDFNPLFVTLPAQFFRHDDHKFEWSREQFRDWAENLIERFPNYSLNIQGIGPPPVGADVDYGYCSQAAIFVRRDDEESTAEQEVTAEEISDYNMGSKFDQYELIAEHDYPYDERTRVEKIYDMARYHINQLEYSSRMDRKEDEYEPFRLEIDLEILVERISQEHSTTVAELDDILRGNNVTIEEKKVIVVSDVEEEEDESDDDYEE